MDIIINTQTPYSYALVDNVFPLEKISSLVDSLCQNTQWYLHKESFFEIYEFNLNSLSSQELGSSDYDWVKGKEVMYQLKSFIENNFNTVLDENYTIGINKLVEGQSIGHHNDAPRVGDSSHRFVVNLNKNYKDADGGHFFVLNLNEGKPEVEEIIRPIINTGFAFESSTESYHSIGKVKEGQRFSLVFSFWHKGNKQILKEELGNKLNSLKEIAIHNPSVLLAQCLKESKELSIQDIAYHKSNLLGYAIDTYIILKQWKMDEEICITGFLRCFLNSEVINKIRVSQSTIALSRYLDDFINVTPESLDTQSELIQTLYFAHIIAIKRITCFASENWQKERVFLEGIKNNLPFEAKYIYEIIYE